MATRPGRRAAGRAVAQGLEPFVGRQRELGELETGLADAAAGRGGMFLVVGEPGIGKTRLADELAARAEASGAAVHWGRCWEGGGAPPYWPWVQIVRSYVRDRDPRSLREELGAPAAQVAQIVPEIRALVPDLPSPPGLEAEPARFALLDAITELLRGAAGRRPLVLVLDDLHAADRPSLRVLQFLARELRGARILVLGSYREAEARRSPRRAAMLGELARVARRMPLRGLSEADVATLVARSAGAEPDPSLVHAVHEATGGSPFFVDELLRLLAAEGRLGGPLAPGERLGVPGGVRESIARRLELLSEEAASALRIAAVIGRHFDARVVERVAALPEEAVLAAIEEAVEAELVVASLRAVRRYSFRHALVRETIYDALPAGRRARLHLEVGEAIAALHGAAGDQHLPELAHHFFEAAAVGGAAQAVELASRAGAQAAAVHAHEQAQVHYRQALEALSLGAEGGERRRCELMLQLGEAERRSGEAQAARRTFDEAARVARGIGAAELLARAALGYAGGLGSFLVTVRADPVIVALLEEALAALPERDSALRARVMALLAAELYYSDEVERPLALSAEAVAIARRLGDPATLLLALYSRHWAALRPETLTERLADARQMVELAGELGDRELAFLAHNARLRCLLERCEIEPVDAELEAIDRLATELRQPYYRWRALCLRTMRAILGARFDQAERLAGEALQIGRRIDRDVAAVYHDWVHLFAVRFAQGRLAEIEEETLAYTRLYPWAPPWRLPLLHSELARGAEARAELERQAASGFELPLDGLWIAHVAALAHACALLADAERAARLYELLLPYEDRSITTISDTAYGPVATRLGMLASVLERWEAAEGHFETGLGNARALRAPTFIALNHCEHARMLLARAGPGDRARALDLLAEAEAICRRHGIGAVLERVVEAQAGARRSREGSGCAFRRDGEYWTVTFGGEVARITHRKGLAYLAQLLANPGAEIHALDLVAAVGARRDDGSDAAATAYAVAEGTHASRLGDAGGALDAEAKAAYRQRLDELNEEVEQARAFNDPERIAGLEWELDAIQRELAAAVGLGGRDRRQASPSERARVNVTRAIRGAIDRIAEPLPALGEHLRASIRTGTACAYLPPPDQRPRWNL